MSKETYLPMWLDENIPAELHVDQTNQVTMRARYLIEFLDNFIKIPWSKHYGVLKVHGGPDRVQEITLKIKDRRFQDRMRTKAKDFL